MVESDAITLPNYPFTFSSIPFSNIDFVSGDYGALFTALVERECMDSAGTDIKTRAPKIWLVRPAGTPVTIGHPCIAIHARGNWK